MSSPEPLSAGSLRDQLRGHLDDLSRQQRKIADYLLDHSQEVPFLSVPLLAERTGASEATVVRLCQSIGYGGFSELKMAMVDALRSEPPGPEMAEAARDDALALVAGQDRNNLDRSLQSIDRAAFREVATALFQADHIFTWGLGISAHLSALAAYLFTEHGLRAHALDHRYSTPEEQLISLRPGDLLLGFSFPPYSRETLDVMRASAERGVTTIAIADRPSAPAAVLADKALAVASDGVMFGNSITAPCLLLNALLLEIAFAHRGETVEALARINRVFSDSDQLIDEE